MNPIGWALATVLSTLVGSIWAHAPMWVVGLISAFAGIVLTVYLFGYIYFMFKNPDALRSERFTLSKMAIEKSIVGDTLQGFSQVEEGQSGRSLAAPTQRTEQDAR